MKAVIGLTCLLAIMPVFHTKLIKSLYWEPLQKESCYEKMIKWKPIHVADFFKEVGKTFYYNYMSRLDLNRKSTALLGCALEDLDEAALYYDSCLKVRNEPNNVIRMIGYGGNTADYLMEQDMSVTEGYRARYYRPEGTGSLDEGGLTMITLTDNKTFAFMPDCTLDNKPAWSVFSTVPVLPKETLADIHKHAKELGYDLDYATEIRYDCCET